MGALAYESSYAPPPSAYCTAKVNSLGCVPSIAVSGQASASSPHPCTITATDELNQRVGLLFYGFAPKATPYQGGFLCVQPPTRRTPLLDSGGNPAPPDCSGVYAFDLNAWIRSGVDPALDPGTFVFAQFWSRDPQSSFATNRTGAARVAIAP